MAFPSLCFPVCTVLAVLILTVPASAGPRTNISVSYRDLDLSSRSGAHTLLARIEKAAEEVCGGDPYKMPDRFDAVILAREFQKCREQVMARAVASVPAPLVAQLYAARTVRTARTEP
jgi:UrcA family protein